MPYHRVCEYPDCQKPFVASHKRARYCSLRCSSAQKALDARNAENVRDYFLERLPSTCPSEQCWPWQGSLNDAGYGMAFVRAQLIRAHRLSYELFVGPIPIGLDILHSTQCTTRACVNPTHLRPGTNQENIADKLITNTQAKGETSPHTHLCDDDIRAIRNLYTTGMPLQEIAGLYNIGRPTVTDIIMMRTWKHIDPDTYTVPKLRKNRLTFDDIRQIRLLGTTQSQKALAAKFGISQQHVGRILQRLIYDNID